MARLRRLSPVGIPQHIIQRGNNRQVCFAAKKDYVVYSNCLAEYSAQFQVDIHAWVFMTNHVHLLATPNQEGAVSKMMQALGRRYVRYFNREHQRTGTLWEGRYKSSLVESESYLLTCQRYIEMNPVRAGMVNDPAEYHWSSYHAHASDRSVGMHTPHQEFINLGKHQESRQIAYRDLFTSHVDHTVIRDIRDSVNRGLVLGRERFKDEIEAIAGQRVRPSKIGRPLKKVT